MGKFEKFVVLAVLFLVTLILVVSLNTDEQETLAQASLGGVEEVTPDPVIEPTLDLVPLWKVEDLDEDLDEVVTEVIAEEVAFDPSTALLSGQVEQEPIESEFLLPEDLIKLPEGAIIQELGGLTETYDSNFFSITVAGDETYQSIALKYYGDEGYAGMIRQVNDDPMTSPSAKTVMLPAFDVRVQRKNRASGQTYTVKTGDTFSGIALKCMDSASTLTVRNLFEANTETCPTLNGLQPGMVLVIP